MFYGPSPSPWGWTTWSGFVRIAVYMACFNLGRVLLDQIFDPVIAGLASFAITLALYAVLGFCWWWLRIHGRDGPD